MMTVYTLFQDPLSAANLDQDGSQRQRDEAGTPRTARGPRTGVPSRTAADPGVAARRRGAGGLGWSSSTSAMARDRRVGDAAHQQAQPLDVAWPRAISPTMRPLKMTTMRSDRSRIPPTSVERAHPDATVGGVAQLRRHVLDAPTSNPCVGCAATRTLGACDSSRAARHAAGCRPTGTTAVRRAQCS